MNGKNYRKNREIVLDMKLIQISRFLFTYLRITI